MPAMIQAPHACENYSLDAPGRASAHRRGRASSEMPDCAAVITDEAEIGAFNISLKTRKH